MRTFVNGMVGIALAGVLALPAQAQDCVGDCNDDGEVTVNELIVAVNIALGLRDLADCDTFGGDVTISGLVQAVNNALLGCNGTPMGECGNGIVEGNEECDDGNTWGGDGCATNCTFEDTGTCILDEEAAATVQTTLFAVPLTLAGSIGVTSGKPGADGSAPVVIRGADLILDPVPVPGLVCACVRGAQLPDQFGPGNTANGAVGCGAGGLADLSYEVRINHNITPDLGGQPCPEEQQDPNNPAICNGLPRFAFTGDGPRGSVFMEAAASIGLINDGGLCNIDPGDPEKGPDGIPCTDDDPNIPVGSSLPFTTGTASGTVENVNNITGQVLGPERPSCGAGPCKASVTGVPADCDALIDRDMDTAFAGSKMVGALPSLNLDPIGDVIVTAEFSCE